MRIHTCIHTCAFHISCVLISHMQTYMLTFIPTCIHTYTFYISYDVRIFTYIYTHIYYMSDDVQVCLPLERDFTIALRRRCACMQETYIHTYIHTIDTCADNVQVCFSLERDFTIVFRRQCAYTQETYIHAYIHTYMHRRRSSMFPHGEGLHNRAANHPLHNSSRPKLRIQTQQSRCGQSYQQEQ